MQMQQQQQQAPPPPQPELAAATSASFPDPAAFGATPASSAVLGSSPGNALNSDLVGLETEMASLQAGLQQLDRIQPQHTGTSLGRAQQQQSSQVPLYMEQQQQLQQLHQQQQQQQQMPPMTAATPFTASQPTLATKTYPQAIMSATPVINFL